ncbi:MAG: Ribosome maturation factor RimP [Syntrophus sp. SKADARSKE-3]|nr:Ribosome maturation factor RimP [Syntrophus sp. SKADARSKE-3]
MIGAKRQYEDRIRELVEPAIEAEGMELILAECLMMEGRWIIRLYIDKPEGVTIDDCSTVSYLAGDILDVHDVLPVSYTLEVSSPGLNRLLARDKDFLTYRGRNVVVKTDVKIDGVRNFKGILTDYVDEAGKKLLIMEVRGKSYSIPREAVISAHLEYDFK